MVHTYHGFPFHEFQAGPLRRAYVSVEQRLGQITDVALCVGTGVAAEAVRRELIAPDRVRTIGVCADEPGRARRPRTSPEARRRARRALGLPADARVVGAVGPADLSEGARGLCRGAGRAEPSRRGRRLDGDGELAGRVRARAASLLGLPGVPGRPGLPGLAGGRLVLAGERLDCSTSCPRSTCLSCPAVTRACPRPSSRR